MKKYGRLLMAGSLLLCASMLLSAGGNQQQGGGSAPKGKTAVQFWHSIGGANATRLETVVTAFNASHTDVEVVATYQGNYWDAASKAITAISAGENPDILMMGPDHVSIFSQEEGLMADLLPFMRKTGVDPNDFIEGFIWDYKINGKIIAMPFARSTPVLFVNKDMLAEKGLKVPTNWAELKDVANAMVIREGNEIKRYGLTWPYSTWYFFMILEQAGGKFFNDARTGMGCIEDGTGVEAFTYIQDLHNSGAMFYDPPSDGLGRQMFIDGKSAMHFHSVADTNYIFDNAKFNCELAWVPQGKYRRVPTGGNSVTILNASKAKDAAWTFLDWCLKDDKGLAYFVKETGYYPVTNSMANGPVMKQVYADNPHKRVAFDQLKYAFDERRLVPQVGAATNEFYVFIQAIMYDNKDVKTQLDILAKSVAELMKE